LDLVLNSPYLKGQHTASAFFLRFFLKGKGVQMVGSGHRELIKLNLACGLKAPLGWINIDNSITEKLSKIKLLYRLLCKIARIKEIAWPKNIYNIDIRKRLPFKSESAKAIFSANVLEHMDYRDATFLIRECFRVLSKGGVLRIIVPNLYQAAKDYVKALEEKPSGAHSHNFMGFIGMDRDEHDKVIMRIIKIILSHSKHYYMYDEWSLKEVLEKNGFLEVQKMNYGQSRISDIELLENDKITNYEYVCGFCLEAIK
jgi:predicted SAM-dependent methyltransferase